MAWVTPKTDWVNGDRFNLIPDYIRIKGNIEYLIDLSQTLYYDYDTPQLESPATEDFPKVSFFNNVVEATRAIISNCYAPPGVRAMRSYKSNGFVWSADDLNAIEHNHLLLYDAFTAQKSSIRRLEYTLGGVDIGD